MPGRMRRKEKLSSVLPRELLDGMIQVEGETRNVKRIGWAVDGMIQVDGKKGNSGAAGSDGGQSKFDDITSDGGTGGARYQRAAPTNSGNGSGGGGGGYTGTNTAGGAGGDQ